MQNRRQIIQMLGATGLLGASSTFAQQRNFTFCSFGGASGAAMKTAFMDPAGKKFGVQVTNASPTSYAKIKAMVEANAVEWDLVDVGGQFIYQGRDQGLLEKLDYSIIDASKLDKVWIAEYGIYMFVGATVCAYNTKAFPEGKGPQTWKDFWNVKDFPGPRSLYTRLWYNYEAALLAAGVPRNEVYPATDEKMKLALSKLREIKPHVKVWWSTGAQPAQLLSSGEVAMASAWSGRILDVMKEKAPVSFTYNDSVAWGEALVVPKGTRNRDLAMRILNYVISDEAQTAFMEQNIYGPVLGTAAAKATDAQAQIFVSHPKNMKNVCILRDEEVAKYVTKYEDDWKKLQLA